MLFPPLLSPVKPCCVHWSQGLILWRCTKRISLCVPSCLVKLPAEISGLNPAFLSMMFFALTVKAPAAPEQLRDHLRGLLTLVTSSDGLIKLAPGVV